MSDAAAPSYFGVAGVAAFMGSFNQDQFQIEQALSKARTATPVKVIAVHGGGTSTPPTVDVQPVINMVDGVGNITPHTTIFGIPVHRYQGGGNAFICDPQPGDLGLMVVSDRDMSALKAQPGSNAPPGSRRQHNLSDGVYYGVILGGGNPTQAVQFTDTGVRVYDKNGTVLQMDANGVTITGNLRVSGTITAGYGGADSVTLQGHTHPDPQGGTTGQPNAGT